jgi:hypothetical protein
MAWCNYRMYEVVPISDIEYLQKKMLESLAVPKAYMGKPTSIPHPDQIERDRQRLKKMAEQILIGGETRRNNNDKI